MYMIHCEHMTEVSHWAPSRVAVRLREYGGLTPVGREDPSSRSFIPSKQNGGEKSKSKQTGVLT